MRTLRPRSTASLMRLNSGGSYDTAKFSVIVVGNYAEVNGGVTMKPRARTPRAIELRLNPVNGTVFGTTSLIAVWLDATMSSGCEIRSYDYVNRPYERVRDASRRSKGASC